MDAELALWNLIQRLQSYRDNNAWYHKKIQRKNIREYDLDDARSAMEYNKGYYRSLMKEMHSG